MTYCVLLGAPHFPVAAINIFFVFPINTWKINIIQGYGFIRYIKSKDDFTKLYYTRGENYDWTD